MKLSEAKIHVEQLIQLHKLDNLLENIAELLIWAYDKGSEDAVESFKEELARIELKKRQRNATFHNFSPS